MNSRLPLDGRWELFYVDHQTYLKYRGVVNTAAALGCSGFDNIPAQVPGNLALDLQNAGKLPDPFMGENTLQLQNLECLHAFYCRTFEYSNIGERVYLTFEGLDDIADIYLNSDKIGSSANMLISHSFGPLSLNDGINELIVHIKPDVIEARAYDIPVSASAMKYNWDGLYTRKAPSMYGWDIMPRALSGGIWRSVFIESRKDEYISDIFVRTLSVDEGSMTARLAVDYTVSSEFNSLRGVKFTLRGICGDAEFYTEQTLWHTSGRFEFTVDGAKLWMPHNYGTANLYDVTASLIRDGAVTDHYTLRVGIRTVALDRTSITDDMGSGEFCFRVNGHKIFAMGSNWVPVDALHSRDAQRLPTLLPMLGDLGCNIVRCWGGNVYENDLFFDYCDAHGIMVWQDFAMACAAYPQDDRFRAMLEPEIISVVKRLRSRACLILWTGDNECDYFYADPQKNAITREWIPGWLALYDNSRPYLPSSPYRDATAVASGCVTPEDHLWGPRDYFKGDYYRNAPAHFASETGYHGCPAPESLARFIPEDKLWPWDNDAWRVHSASPERAKDAPYSYRNGLMASQVRTLFGYEPNNLEEFSRASQISQAEAKKYFIERFRVSKWRRTGIIWWNLVDGWPQISDAIVDYYGVRKLAYQYIKRSQQPVCLIFGEPENGMMTLYGVNDTQRDIELDYIVTELDSGACCHSGKAQLPQNASVKLWEMPYTSHMQKFMFIQWSGDTEGVNHHMTGMPGLNLERYVELAKKAGFVL